MNFYKNKTIYIFVSFFLTISFAESQTVQDKVRGGQCPKAFGLTAPDLKPITSPIVQKQEENRALLLQEPRFVFAENFKKGFIEGPNSYFVVDQKSFNRRMPLGRILKKTSETSAIVEIIEPSSGTLREISVYLMQQKTGEFYLTSRDHPLFKGIVRQGRPDIELVFLAVRSEREELSSKELSLYPQTDSLTRSKALKNQGYSQAYIRHIDEVSHGQALKEKLTSAGVNPYRTHIEHLAESLFFYINYIRQGIKNLPVWELIPEFRIQNTELFVTHFKKEIMNRLVQLEQRVISATENKQMTYQQFLKFIGDLAQIANYNLPSYRNKKFDPQLLSALLEYFPIMIAVPQKGEIGVMALNELIPQGVYPLGLSYRVTKVDGRDYSPIEFTMHDTFHALFSLQLKATSFNPAHERFHNRWVVLRESLPLEKRKNVELAYYTLTHEMAHQPFVTLTPEQMRKTIQQSLISQITGGHNFKGLKDFSQNQKEQVLEIANDWVTIFETINRDLGFL